VAGTLLFGYHYHPIPCLLLPLMLVSLLYGGIAVLCGLFLRANRQGARLWKHVGVLVCIVVLLPVLTVGPGNYFGLIDLRTRLAVARTGGQEQLQAWAIALLDEYSDRMDPHDMEERVPQEDWSKQVRRLKPDSVHISAVFENAQKGVLLSYGSGFFHWWIVIGRPGSQPDPKLNDPNSDNFWYRWADGIYDWQQG
jgi:hypothetical protein